MRPNARGCDRSRGQIYEADVKTEAKRRRTKIKLYAPKFSYTPLFVNCKLYIFYSWGIRQVTHRSSLFKKLTHTTHYTHRTASDTNKRRYKHTINRYTIRNTYNIVIGELTSRFNVARQGSKHSVWAYISVYPPDATRLVEHDKIQTWETIRVAVCLWDTLQYTIEESVSTPGEWCWTVK